MASLDRKLCQCYFAFMEGVGKLFLMASLFYLALGTAMGFTMAFLKGKWTLRLMPAHTHINLYGWVSQLIFGFAYSYLPTFAGRNLYSSTLPYIHFILGNIGLIGMAAMFIGSRFPRSPISPRPSGLSAPWWFFPSGFSSSISE